MVTPACWRSRGSGPAVGKLCAHEGALTGAEDAQMSSRYRWLVTSPASHVLPSAGERPVRLQKRSTNACLTSGAMREASPHTNTAASFCKRSHTASPFGRDRLLHMRFRLARLAGEG